jgi:hypothetical protein
MANETGANETGAHEHVLYETEDSADITLLRQRAPGADLTLRVVALERVKPHEHYHEPRVVELAARLVAEGRLVNPPVVVQQGESYVVLDGATRLTALRQLGYPCVIVQVVEVKQQGVLLSSWNHALYGVSEGELLALLRAVPGLRLSHTSSDPLVLPEGALAYLRMASSETYLLEPESSMGRADVEWLGVLNALVAAYGRWGNVERTLSHDMTTLAAQFPDLAALVIFPRFTPQMILSLAALGRTVPAGITRFLIPGRILRLNVPLEKLAADESLDAKQAWLDELIRSKVRERQVRYYEEPVILLDE